MNMLTTKEILEKVSASGDFKATAPVWKLFVLGILAGAYIAFGAYASTVASFNLVSDPSTFGLGKVVAGAVFPVGLMLVVLCGAELFTGNCLMVTGLFDKRFGIGAMLRNWVIVYAGNLVGALLLSDICKKHGIAIRHIILRQDAWCRWLVFALSTAIVLLFGVWGPSFSEANFIYFQF